MLLGLLALFALGALNACRDDAPERQADPLRGDLAAVLQQVSDLRGIEAPGDVEASSVARDDVRELLADTLTGADREAFERMTDLYQLLGFIGAEEDYEDIYLDFAARALIGFYETARDRLWVVSDEAELDFESFDATLRSTVAHEFVHALQDARFDLPALLERASSDLDWALALSAVLEGDAVQHERLWAREHLASSEVSGTPVRGVSGGSIPAAIERELRWPYEGGLDWVSLAGMANSNALTNAVLSGERITTAEILHPDLRASGWRPVQVSIPDLSNVQGIDWERTGSGSFGEFRLRNLLQLHLGGLQSVAAATGWAGDSYALFRHGDESTAVLRVAFADEKEQAEFGVAIGAWLQASGAEVRNEGARASAALKDGRAVVVRPEGSGYVLVFGSTSEMAQLAADILEGG